MRLRVGGTLALLVLVANLWAAAQPGPWDPALAMLPAAGLLVVATALGHRWFGGRRSPGWNVAWLGAGSSMVLQAAGLGLAAGHAPDDPTALVLGPWPGIGGDAAGPGTAEVGTLLVVVGAVGLVASTWLMLRERVDSTVAVDILAEALLMGASVAYLLAVSGLAMTPHADGSALSGADVLALVPVVGTVATTWLLARLGSLTSDAPGAYRWLTLVVLALCLAMALFASTSLVRSGHPDLRWAVRAVPVIFSLVVGGWSIAVLDRTIAEPFERVLAPARATQAHLPVLVVLGALGPILATVAMLAMAEPPVPALGIDLASDPALLALGSLVVPAVAGAQVFRRLHAQYASSGRDHRDALTGLADSTSFRLAVGDALEQPGGAPAVLYLDLDRFKAINDSLGHAVGDQLLRAVAKRLRQRVPADALVGRLGGDEFAILLPHVVGVAEAERLADEIIDAFRDRHRIEDRDLFVSTSIGIAVGTRGQDADTLVKHADVAMYRAKRRRDHRRVTYSSQLDTQARLRLSLESGLRAAVQGGAFALYYQPKVDAGTHEVVGYEALLRWRHPALGVLPPNAFLPVAEETGLVRVVGDWVLAEACRVLGEWQSSGRRMVPIAVNISPRQIAGTDLFTLARDALRHAGADPRFLELELTESTLLEDIDGVAEAVARLRELGVKVALDDFGTGYSALGYLQQIRFDWIKLDRVFVEGVDEHEHPQPVVSAVLALARELGTPVVAEGVETVAQAKWLAAQGAQVLQGYLFGRPEPLASYDTLARSRPPRGREAASLRELGMSVERMHRILADIAADVSPDASQYELLRLAEALEASSPQAIDLDRRRERWSTRAGRGPGT